MILSFDKFINENKGELTLLFYAFDWDDNILNMPTVIHMEKLVDGEWIPTDVSTADFAIVRSDSDNWRIINNDPEPAFSEFRDYGPRGEDAFVEDTKKAIELGKFGPAWDDFIEALTSGCLFAIITARGHEDSTLRKGVEWIIDNVLTKEQTQEMYDNIGKFVYLFNDEAERYQGILRGTPSQDSLIKLYLDNCVFAGVSAPSRGGSAANPEKAKEEVLLGFKKRVNELALSIGAVAKIGFSDDDLKNVKHIEDLIDNLNKEEFPAIISMMVKNTNRPEEVTKKVRTFENISQTPGLESSVMPFAKFNNLAQGTSQGTFALGGSEDRQDDYGNVLKKKVKHLSGVCKSSKCNKELCSNKKCK